MKKYLIALSLIILGALLCYGFIFKSNMAGYRDLEMKVNVAGQEILIWKTVIAPQQENIPGIALHRHKYARILIPLTEGVLQRREPDGQTTDYILTIGKPIFLAEDTPEGFHTDENLGKSPIEVIVLQFTQTPVAVEALTSENLRSVMDFN